jgi:hypothetical protein
MHIKMFQFKRSVSLTCLEVRQSARVRDASVGDVVDSALEKIVPASLRLRRLPVEPLHSKDRSQHASAMRIRKVCDQHDAMRGAAYAYLEEDLRLDQAAERQGQEQAQAARALHLCKTDEMCFTDLRSDGLCWCPLGSPRRPIYSRHIVCAGGHGGRGAGRPHINVMWIWITRPRRPRVGQDIRRPRCGGVLAAAVGFWSSSQSGPAASRKWWRDWPCASRRSLGRGSSDLTAIVFSQKGHGRRHLTRN